MPELPEVETSRRGIKPYLEGESIDLLLVRQPKLRWPVPTDLPKLLKGKTILSVRRRAKYLLIDTTAGSVILHLGMSGSLCIVDKNDPAGKHDHLDFILQNGTALRFTDPRRFGAVLWGGSNPLSHPLLANLGPEPLSADLTANYLYRKSRGRKITIKQLIMQGNIIAGIGNIYACEALFRASILPLHPAGSLSLQHHEKLILAIREVLVEAIAQGGTTLRDFVNAQGRPGYFKQKLQVYGRAGIPCVRCTKSLKEIRLGQRATFFCSNCQH